jgi:hypothetical protein
MVHNAVPAMTRKTDEVEQPSADALRWVAETIVGWTWLFLSIQD